MWLFDSNVNKHTGYYLQVRSGNVKTNYLAKSDKLKNSVFLYYNFYNNDLVSWPVCDTIYRTDSGKPVPAYVIDFNGKSFFDLKSDEPLSMTELSTLNQDKTSYRWIKDVAPYQSGVYFAFKYDRTYFVKHEGGKTAVYSKLVDGLPDTDVAAVGHTEHEMIYAFPMDELLAYKENGILPDKDPVCSLYRQVKDEEDNPVLVFVDLNEK